MSNSNRIRVSIVAESSFGVTGSSPAWQVLATTGQSIRDRMGYQQSQTINNDRNVQDLVRLSKAAGGGIPMELTYSPTTEGLDMLLIALMCNSYAAASSRSGCDVDATAKTVTNNTGNWSADNVEVGDILKLTVTSGGALIGYYRVASISTNVATIADADDTLSSDASGTVTATRGARLTNGTTEATYAIEVARLDLQIAQVFTGCVVDAMDFTVADGAITTANFSIVAAGSTRYTTNNGTTDLFAHGGGTPTYTDPTASPVLDSIAVPEVRSGGAAYAAKSINMSLANNAAARTQVGALGAQSMRWGQFGANGRISAYMEDFTDLAAYADNTATDLWLAMIDANANGYTLSLPQIKFSDAGADTRGVNQDDLVEIAATAYKDPTELITARLQRWD